MKWIEYMILYDACETKVTVSWQKEKKKRGHYIMINKGLSHN